MATNTESSPETTRREHGLLLRRALKLGTAALSALLLFGVVEATHAPTRAKRSYHAVTRWAGTGYDSLNDLLNSLSYEPAHYDNPTEQAIYEEIGQGRAKQKQLPVIEGVLAVSNNDMRAQADQLPSFAIQNPVLVSIKNGDQTDQYLVAHNGRTADTPKDLLYIPLADAQFCSTVDAVPRVVNRMLGSNRQTNGFEATDVGTVVYVPADIAAGCQREVAVSEINQQTLQPAA